MKPASKAIIKLGYSCNNNCLFCHAKAKRQSRELDTGNIKKKIMRLKDLGIEMAVLSGGEPTIRKDILEIFEFASRNSIRTGLVTNARMLQYEKLVSRIEGLGLGYVCASLHGSEDIHNRLTGTEGFRQTLAGIRNISRLRGVELLVNCVVTKTNLMNLRGVIDCIRGIRVDRIKFSLMEPVQEAGMEIIPEINRACERVKDAMGYGEREGFRTGMDGFPLCLMKGYEKRTDNLKTNNILYVSEAYEDEFFPSDEGNRMKGAVCRECRIPGCEGTYREYLPGMVST